MIEGIIASLIAAIIGSITVFLYRKGYIQKSYDWFLFLIAPKGDSQQSILPKKLSKFQNRIKRRLLLDQSRFGYHRGQFGKSCDSLNADKWQTKGSKENLNLKPRMYLTYWPIFILSKYKLEQYSLNLAIKGIKELFHDDKIPVFSSAPHASPTGLTFTFNIRHTMAGAHILALKNPNNTITRAVIGQMLDINNNWQDKNGGWKQTSDLNSKVDLWASTYAIKLLDFAITKDLKPFDNKADFLIENIKRTMTFIEKEFKTSRWGDPGKLLVEENLVSIFIDLAPLLLKYSQSLYNDCMTEMKNWLDNAGNLSEKYLSLLEKQSTPVSKDQAYARMAYAFYLANDDSWKLWFEGLSKSSLKTMFSSELAFLLELTFKYYEKE
ncbi:MAG: hypothetical protein JW870_05135 [Candidatus Delongbacteria bacterium]|nr:hypothetical protein [Candidatus Delongbacteria bacterium]